MNTELFNGVTLTEDGLRFYREEGYLLIRSILTETGLEEMRRQCMRAWEGEKGEFDPKKTWLQNSLLVDIHHKAPAVRDYYFNGPLPA